MPRLRARSALLAASLCLPACDDPGAATGALGGAGGGDATFNVRESVEQIHVWGAEPGTALEVVDEGGAALASGVTDTLGSLVFRELPAGERYRVRTRSGPAMQTGPLRVVSVAESTMPPDLPARQRLQPGLNYIETRDGTRLAAYVTMPGPPEAGPYPTVVNMSGYDPARPGEPIEGVQVLCGAFPSLCDPPSDPSALIASLFGYATVGVNLRGTGCSGGAFDFFEPLQLFDGYDVIEVVAAQPWVQYGKVGMTGLSYPGITQLFVAQLRPPGLAAITPLSVIGSTASTLRPGGILNDGFAIEWGRSVLDKADPYGQGWERARVDAGDAQCEENQLLHGQKVDIIAKARRTLFYDPAVVGPLDPSSFVERIDVPVFLAGAWQDEQTGPFFHLLLDRFTASPDFHAKTYNGVHVDGFAPEVLAEWKAFLDLYVARKVPEITEGQRFLSGQLFGTIFGASVTLPENRWADVSSYDEALARWRAAPRVELLFENGSPTRQGGGTASPGAPVPGFRVPAETWPPPSTSARRWYFHADGSLGDSPPSESAAASRFELDPAAGQEGILAPGGDVWDALPDYRWEEPAAGKVVSFLGAPLEETLVMAGTGSVDLWLRADVDDADLEVTLSEVRPDGEEMYVQSGWLRASHRALGPTSTELFPWPTHLEQDHQPLRPGEWVEVRIAIAPFTHVFRAGSRVRVSIDTPGGSRAAWRFELKTFVGGARYDVAHDSLRPSSVALPVLAGVSAPTPRPPCPSLRGQPCRTFAPPPNVVAP